MATEKLSASALIEVPAQKVYEIIADYNNGHPRILPKPPFVALRVEEGGTGAGSMILIEMRVLGQIQTIRSVVTEPEPGRVLVETNDNGYVTTFTVEPRAEGQHAHVTIETDMSGGRGGLLGVFERWFVARLMRPAFARELENLAAVAAE